MGNLKFLCPQILFHLQVLCSIFLSHPCCFHRPFFTSILLACFCAIFAILAKFFLTVKPLARCNCRNTCGFGIPLGCSFPRMLDVSEPLLLLSHGMLLLPSFNLDLNSLSIVTALTNMHEVLLLFLMHSLYLSYSQFTLSIHIKD